MLLISAMLTAAYLLPPSVSSFFGGMAQGEAAAIAYEKKDPPLMMIPITILTLAILLLGIFPGFMIEVFTSLANTLF